MEDFYITEAMMVYGGRFVSSLAHTYRKGDMQNQAKIRHQWPEVWEKYTEIAKLKIDELKERL